MSRGKKFLLWSSNIISTSRDGLSFTNTNEFLYDSVYTCRKEVEILWLLVYYFTLLLLLFEYFTNNRNKPLQQQCLIKYRVHLTFLDAMHEWDPHMQKKSVCPQTISEVQPTCILLVRVWMHDRVLARFSQPVQNVVNNIYHDKWIGTVGVVAWPPCSPDLNHLDF